VNRGNSPARPLDRREPERLEQARRKDVVRAGHDQDLRVMEELTEPSALGVCRCDDFRLQIDHLRSFPSAGVLPVAATQCQWSDVRGPTDPIHPGRERYARYVAALYESAQFASGAGMERYREWWPFDPPTPTG